MSPIDTLTYLRNVTKVRKAAWPLLRPMVPLNLICVCVWVCVCVCVCVFVCVCVARERERDRESARERERERERERDLLARRLRLEVHCAEIRSDLSRCSTHTHVATANASIRLHPRTTHCYYCRKRAGTSKRRRRRRLREYTGLANFTAGGRAGGDIHLLDRLEFDGPRDC